MAASAGSTSKIRLLAGSIRYRRLLAGLAVLLALVVLLAACTRNTGPTTDATVGDRISSLAATLPPQAVPPTAAPTETPTTAITPSPSPSLSPTSSPAPLASAIVLRGANLRAGPGTAFEVIGTASQGEELPVFGLSNDSMWVMVNLEEPAWIWVDLVELSLDIAEVDAVTTLTPIGTPTSYPMASRTASRVPSPTPLPSSTPSPSDLIEALVLCNYAVENSLKAPRTAKFPWADVRRVTILGNNRFRIDSYVDAENSFGAMLRSNFTCTVQKVDEETWHLESLRFK